LEYNNNIILLIAYLLAFLLFTFFKNSYLCTTFWTVRLYRFIIYVVLDKNVDHILYYITYFCVHACSRIYAKIKSLYSEDCHSLYMYRLTRAFYIQECDQNCI